MRHNPHLQKFIRPLVAYRFLLSLGVSAACGIVLNSIFPIDAGDRLLRLIALQRPTVFHSAIWSYDLFLYSTPFLACSMIFSLLYVHLYRSEQNLAAGILPPYPDSHSRTELSLVLGEVHRQLVPKPSPTPQWLSIPERGLYTGIASFGSIGSGKTYGLILPAMRQLFAYRAAGDRRDTVKGIGCEYVHVAIDDHSRIAFSAIYPDETRASVLHFLEKALAYYARIGIHFKALLIDNGTSYRSYAFADRCRELGLKHRRTRPYTPRTNGKAERFIQTALREWAYARTYKNSEDRKNNLEPWMHQYNWHRPHASLGLSPPISRSGLDVNNLLSHHT